MWRERETALEEGDAGSKESAFEGECLIIFISLVKRPRVWGYRCKQE